MKIFVIHYDKLVERKQNMLKQLEQYNVEAEFISNHGKENLTIAEKLKFKNLTGSEISLFLHHVECHKSILKNNYDYALILEDDALFCPDFMHELKKYMADLPPHWDICYLGVGTFNVPYVVQENLKALAKRPVHVFRKPYTADFKYTDSMLVSKKFSQAFLNDFYAKKTVGFAIDMHLNGFINNNKKIAFVVEPKLVAQGSIQKVFPTAISHTL